MIAATASEPPREVVAAKFCGVADLPMLSTRINDPLFQRKGYVVSPGRWTFEITCAFDIENTLRTETR